MFWKELKEIRGVFTIKVFMQNLRLGLECHCKGGGRKLIKGRHFIGIVTVVLSRILSVTVKQKLIYDNCN